MEAKSTNGAIAAIIAMSPTSIYSSELASTRTRSPVVTAATSPPITI